MTARALATMPADALPPRPSRNPSARKRALPRLPRMNAALSWALALAALVTGFLGYGWRGLVLALSVIVFWLLLQFSRALRTLRDAAGRPVGRVDNAVMLNARLHPGMRLPKVLALTRCLGRKVGDAPEAFEWQDAAGDRVRVELHAGRVSRWQLHRSDVAAAPEPPHAA